MRTIHIITGLEDGGAEAVLYRLCQRIDSNDQTVLSLRGDGKYGPLIRALGIPVICLGMPPGRIRFSAILRLWRLIKAQDPDLVQTWMYHGDLVGGVVARLAGIRNIVWGVHHTTLERGKAKRSTIWVAKACANLSRLVPRKIICCAESAARIHGELGYDSERLVVVNNGYDLVEFEPNADSGLAVRRDLCIPPNAVLLGMVGRFDPQKDHENFVRALWEIRARGHDFYCLLVGKDVDQNNVQLKGLIQKFGLTERVMLAGQRSDMPAVMNALDLHVLSSAYGEAFPNVLAEAMACGTPCVATDVGDSAVIVGQTGWVVPAKNTEKLADGLSAALTALKDGEAWQLRRRDCRGRIQERFSVEAMVARYQGVWQLGS